MRASPNRMVLASIVAAAATVVACGRAGSNDGRSGPTLRIAAVQFDAAPERPAENLATMERLTRAAAARGAQLVLFHENALLDYGERVRELAQAVPEGEACRRLATLAAELDVWIGAGLAERADGHVYLTQVLLGPAGLVGRYRKTFLFSNPADARRDEPRHFDRGSGPQILDVAGLRTAVLICSDAEAPELVAELRALAPELVLFPNNRSNLPAPETFAWLARELGAPLVLANRSGTSWQYDCNGGSCILDREGNVLASANRGGTEEILLCDVPVPDRRADASPATRDD